MDDTKDKNTFLKMKDAKVKSEDDDEELFKKINSNKKKKKID